MKRIPVVFIGLGRIASLLEDDPLREKPCTHAGAVAANPDCRIAAGMDTDPKRRACFAARWDCAVYDNTETMIKIHAPLIAVVATAPHLHEEYCTLASALGVPVIICEKPLADTLAGARRIGRLPARILVNHERRYAKNYRRAKEILESRQLGELLSIKMSLCMGKARKLSDVLWNDGTHLIDMLLFLSASSIQKIGQPWGAALESKSGTAFLSGTLESGVEFCIEVGAGRDYLVFEIECNCSAGRLQIGNDIFSVWESAPSPYAKGFRALAKTEESVSGPTGYFTTMIADAVACVREAGRMPCSQVSESIAGIEFLDSITPD
ncbi:MAG: Gfo/Idh/MocA family oxidoreductase [Spirochaetaceae bacterium]|nr:Gfo/Idh/MocA family oxidoreductase [Spirochaetaceae bacterium]